jgi:hypothetical protein
VLTANDGLGVQTQHSITMIIFTVFIAMIALMMRIHTLGHWHT